MSDRPTQTSSLRDQRQSGLLQYLKEICRAASAIRRAAGGGTDQCNSLPWPSRFKLLTFVCYYTATVSGHPFGWWLHCAFLVIVDACPGKLSVGENQSAGRLALPTGHNQDNPLLSPFANQTQRFNAVLWSGATSTIPAGVLFYFVFTAPITA